MTRRVRGGLLAVCIVLAMVGTYALAGAHQHREAVVRLDAANSAVSKHEWITVIEDAKGAAMRAWPGSDTQRSAFALLRRAGHEAEDRADTPTALVAWTGMRQAALATRSVLSDTTAWQTEAEQGVRRASH